MKTSSAKSKGRRACQEVKELLHKYQPQLQDEDIRVTPSGLTGEDLMLSPLAKQSYPLVFEMKNQEKISIWAALAQCESHENKDGRLPVLFFKRNRSKMYVTLDAEEFLKIFTKNNKKVDN